MEEQVKLRLIEINNQFYQTFASQFSTTRQRLQPGVQRILKLIPPEANVLDLGCGNGALMHALILDGFRGRFIGIDSSSSLLQIANRDLQEIQALTMPVRPVFFQADLSDQDWDISLCSYLPGFPSIKFDFILAFAVLHHLPGWDLRLQTLIKINRLLATGGSFFHSEWQFLNSPRLRTRIQSWRLIGIQEKQVDQGDFLLDWRQGGNGLRYAHHFTFEELSELAIGADFQIVASFYSDGREGNLAIYQTWQLNSIIG